MLTRRQNGQWGVTMLAGAVWLALADSAQACSSRTGGVFDWDRCWSLSRGLTAILVIGFWAYICFWVLFPRLLSPSSTALDKSGRSTAPWPMTAFGQALGLFW